MPFRPFSSQSRKIGTTPIASSLASSAAFSACSRVMLLEQRATNGTPRVSSRITGLGPKPLDLLRAAQLAEAVHAEKFNAAVEALQKIELRCFFVRPAAGEWVLRSPRPTYRRLNASSKPEHRGRITSSSLQSGWLSSALESSRESPTSLFRWLPIRCCAPSS